MTLAISERTVENHGATAYAKLGIRSRAQLIALRAESGVLTGDTRPSQGTPLSGQELLHD
jgi:hypothetical protein